MTITGSAAGTRDWPLLVAEHDVPDEPKEAAP